MERKLRIALAAGATVIAVSAIGGGIAVASGGDDDEAQRPIPAGALDRASKAALVETGGGRVTETEVGDEESFYEVEVTFDDGRQVDVQLDEEFKVVDVMNDEESEGDD
jgi:uncharacterized membrane protein YkoI